MGKLAMGMFAGVFFLVLGFGSTMAAEKSKPSKDVTSTPRAAEKAKLPKDVTSTPTGKVLNDLGKGNQPAGHVFDGRKGNPPPVQVNKSTSKRTPRQAIDEYKKSGPPPSGNKGLKIKPPPPPPPPPPSAPPKKK
jgi:hypothetical protein